MIPVLFKIGPIAIHSYGLMIAVGFLAGLYFVQRDAVKRGYNPKIFSDLAFILLPLGVAGTRLAHILMFPGEYSWSDPVGWFAVWRGGLVFQGALPPTLLFTVWYLRRHKVPFWPACDIMFPYVPLGHAFGRIGCFLNGCCYGKPTSVAWGIPAHRVPWDTGQPPTGSPAFLEHMGRFSDVTAASHWSHAIHPTQLYESAGLLFLFGVMLLLRKRWNPFAGFTMPVYFVLYGVLRFIVEMYRGDHNPVHVGALTDQQFFALACAAAGVILFAILAIRARRRPQPAGNPRTPLKQVR